jgi:hypothetical protein
MSEQKELEKLQAMRAELEAQSRLLIEEQKKLENNVIALEEKVVIEKLNKEKAIIEDLKNRNKAAKDAISQLEAKKKDLESKLGQTIQEPETPPPQKKKTQNAPEPAEAEPEEDEEGGVTVTAIEDEALIENQEAVDEGSTKQEKKKRRFF